MIVFISNNNNDNNNTYTHTHTHTHTQFDKITTLKEKLKGYIHNVLCGPLRTLRDNLKSQLKLKLKEYNDLQKQFNVKKNARQRAGAEQKRAKVMCVCTYYYYCYYYYYYLFFYFFVIIIIMFNIPRMYTRAHTHIHTHTHTHTHTHSKTGNWPKNGTMKL